MLYNVCFVSFSHLSKDARTYNIVKNLAEWTDNKIALISLDEDFALDLPNLKQIKIKAQGGNSWIRWYNFHKQIRKLFNVICSQYYYACDLYSLPISYFFAKHYKARLYYDSREVYSHLGALKDKPVRQQIIRKIEAKYIRRCTSVITSGKLDSDFIKAKYNLNQEFLEILNLPEYQERTKSDYLRQKFSIAEDDIILLYQGVILEGRGLEQIISSIKYLNSSIKLVILGSGPKASHYKEVVKLSGAENRIFFHDAVDYQSLHEITCSADLGLCLFQPITKSYEYSLPNKLFEYSMAGLPVIATDLPQQAKIINENSNGILVKPYTQGEELAGITEDFINSDLNIYKQNSLYVGKKFNYATQKEIILSLFKDQIKI